MQDGEPQGLRNEREERQVATVDLTARLLLADGSLFEVRLLDLSYKGCRLEGLPHAFERGHPVGVELPGLTEYTIGRCAWCDGDAMGVEFESPLFEPVYRYLHDKLFGLDDAA